ncbi:hypothetical protein [Mycoplasma sp. CR]|uniref:hypothetical protein n=1 Tax=Mycoplasma sp. CR TaxID=3401693 RepID=UPI003AB0E7F1
MKKKIKHSPMVTTILEKYKKSEKIFNIVKNSFTYQQSNYVEKIYKNWPLSVRKFNFHKPTYELPKLEEKQELFICNYIEIIEKLPAVLKFKEIFSENVYEDFLDIFHLIVGDPVMEERQKLDLTALNDASQYVEYLFSSELNKNSIEFKLGSYNFKAVNNFDYMYLFNLPEIFEKSLMNEIILVDSLNRPRVFDIVEYIGQKSDLVVAQYSEKILDHLNECNIKFCLRLDSLRELNTNLFHIGKRISSKILDRLANGKGENKPFLVTKKNFKNKEYYLYAYLLPTRNTEAKIRDYLLNASKKAKNRYQDEYFDVFQESYIRFFLTNKKLVDQNKALLPIHNSRLEWDHFVIDKVNYSIKHLTKLADKKYIINLGIFLLFIWHALSDITARINAIHADIYNSDYHYNLNDIMQILYLNEQLSAYKSASFELSTYHAVVFENTKRMYKLLELISHIVTKCK